MFVLLAFLTKLAHSSPFINSPINSADCAPIDSVIEIGLCSQIVNELHLLHNIQVYGAFGERKVHDFYQNVTDICEKINACFEKSNCTDVRRAGSIYKQKCATLDFRTNSMEYCMSHFYQEVYENKTECIKDQDWFSDDIEIKTNAYRNGKACVLDVAKRKCSGIGSYLETRYDDLIYLLTTNTSDAFSPLYRYDIYTIITSNKGSTLNGCNSLHDQLVARQCEPVYMGLRTEVYGWQKGNNSAETDKRLEENCEKIKSCVSKYCVFDTNLRVWGLGQSCSFASPANRTAIQSTPPIQKQPSISFDDCFVHIVTSANATYYSCVQKYKLFTHHEKNLANDIFNRITQTYYLSGVLNNKNCVRTLMRGECEPSAVENFEKDWTRIRRSTVAMKRRLRDDSDS